MESESLLPPVFNTHKKRKSTPRITWLPQAVADFKVKYPTCFNSDLAIEFKCDVRTILRKAREFGLEKTPDFMKANKAEIIRRSLIAKEHKILE